jgi:hypothetical protein
VKSPIEKVSDDDYLTSELEHVQRSIRAALERTEREDIDAAEEGIDSQEAEG